MRESDGAITRRFTDPFGNSGDSAATWATVHGFLNAPVSESTGLTQVGVRAYDPASGRFLSVDPVRTDAATAPSTVCSPTIRRPAWSPSATRRAKAGAERR
ncbi:RHS repeat-associated core domain-containing protein [uncultured Leifsonia sp.]|uniref:RHS repeat-associated core domain-containing protein n=1 Tax=uncultured Leifsonia sp. TaxID=340359 RepID=UPI0037DD43DF